MLLSIPLLAATAGSVLVWRASQSAAAELDPVTSAALLVIAAAELFTPIVPLALMPINTGKLGSAYGRGEALFAAVQVAIALLLGAVRTFWGFPGAMAIIMGGMTLAFAVAAPLHRHARDLPTVGSKPWLALPQRDCQTSART